MQHPHAATITALRKRLARWEIEHLRVLAAKQDEQLECAAARIEELEAEVERAWRYAEMWRDDIDRLVEALEDQGTPVGLAQSGELFPMHQQGGAV